MSAARGKQLELEDAAITKERIVTGVATSKNSNIKVVALKWIALANAAQNESLSTTQDAYQAFCAALAELELQARKLAAVHAANSRELQGYEDKQKQLEVDTAQARALIAHKKEQLAEARVWRKQQEEYEVLREQITKLPARHETQQAIDEVNRDIASIQAAISQQQHLYEVIGKKVAAVRYQIEDLLAAYPTQESLAGDAAGDAAQPMQLDS